MLCGVVRTACSLTLSSHCPLPHSRGVTVFTLSKGCYLGDDGGGGDAEALSVPVHHRLARYPPPTKALGDAVAVHQHKVRNTPLQQTHRLGVTDT
eukprot:1186652-Prorocentrum_minimum.AAC.1